jgi:hypothetical protein
MQKCVSIAQGTTEWQQFRQSLYQNLNKRADTLLELIDALCSSPAAQSVAELSLAPAFRRSYSALYKAVDGFAWSALQGVRWLAPYLPRPQGRPFWLLGLDVTPQPRVYAETLGDRGMVYAPQPVKGGKPVTIGHQYSTLALLPAAEADDAPPWVVPLLSQRVASTDDKELVGVAQLAMLLAADDLPFAHALCVVVGDTAYSKPEVVHALGHHANLVSIARVRSNRVFYRQGVAAPRGPHRGRPTRYGAAFRLKELASWPPPTETAHLTQTTPRGQVRHIALQAWPNLLMPGKRKPVRIEMYRHPFTLVRVVRTDGQGAALDAKPVWLLVSGQRRQQLSLAAIYQSYQQRGPLEHFFRFAKQRLLLADFQTPETGREEKWWRLVHLAYAQLWLARPLADGLPRPWERSLPASRSRCRSPTLVQRDFARLIRQLGTPAQAPKRRGKSPGRAKGQRLPPRQRYKVVVKGRKQARSP